MSEIDEISLKIVESLRRNDQLRRKHADFWNFYKKSSKELGLFSEIFARFEADYESKVIQWGLCEDEPPDIFVSLANGRKVGIEITELVNEASVIAQLKKSPDYSTELIRFGFDEACEEISRILKKKSTKTAPKLTDYDALVLLIHSDEPMLKSDQFLQSGTLRLFERSPIFECVYLLFSYEPDKQECPLIKLEFK